MARIEILLDTNVYFPAQTVRGRVSVKTHEPLNAAFLKIRFFKSQKLFLKKVDGTEPKVLIDKNRVIIDREFMIADHIYLPSGIAIFPFRMNLKPDENGSGQMKGYFYDLVCQVKNNYNLEAQCHVGDQVIRAEKSFTVLDRNKEKQFIDSKIRLSSFICLLTKSIQFRIQTDKEWYFTGDNVQIECFPISKTSRSMISGIDANLYEIAVFNRESGNILRSRMASTFQAFPLNKNHFRMQFRLPMNIGPTITEKDFVIRTAVFFNIKFYNGSSMKIKKYINVGQIALEIPEIESALYYETKTYCEQIIDY